jgi:hypothetical protein
LCLSSSTTHFSFSDVYECVVAPIYTYFSEKKCESCTKRKSELNLEVRSHIKMQSTYVLYLCGYDSTLMLRSAKHRHIAKGKGNIHLEILIIFFLSILQMTRNVHNLFSISLLLLLRGPSDIHLFSPMPAKNSISCPILNF